MNHSRSQSLLALSERSLNENHSAIEEERKAFDSDLKLDDITSEQIMIILQAKEIGKSLAVGYFLTTVLAVTSKEVFEVDYITSDDDGIYNHPFVPENIAIDVCVICEDCRANHARLQIKKSEKQLAESFVYIKTALSNQATRSKLESLIETENCNICYMMVPKSRFFHLNGENHEICISCLKKYLFEEINEGKVLDIKCPHCLIKLEDRVIAQYVDEGLYQKYTRFVRNNQILADPLMRWCPNSSCSTVIKIPDKNLKTFPCQNCKTVICLLCNREDHPDLSCDQMLDRELKDWSKAKDVQRCPYCKVVVEKASGCNHMTCQVCHHEWCWLCGSVYTNYHYMPFNPFGCPGLQGGVNRTQNWGFCRLLLWRLLIFLLIILALPFLIVFFGPILFISLIIQSNFWRHIPRNPLWKKALVFTGILTLAIILTPLFIVLILISLIPFLIAFIYQYVNQRLRVYRINRRYDQNRPLSANASEIVIDVPSSVQENN